MKNIIKQLESMSPQEISSQPPGTWDDNDLLEVVDHFTRQQDFERATEVKRLILRSPEHSEMVDYSDLYSEMLEHERHSGNYPAALRWAYASLAYMEQHGDYALNKDNMYRDLIATYLQSGDFDTGLAMCTRFLISNPLDAWTYNTLGWTLPQVGLSDLATEVLLRGMVLVAKNDSENLRKQFKLMHKEAVQKAADAPSLLHLISPKILTDFRTALQGTEPHPAGLNFYLPPIDRLINNRKTVPEKLSAEILAQGKILAADLIRLVFDWTLSKTQAPIHAVTLLRLLNTKKIVELDELKPLLDLVDSKKSEVIFHCNIGKIGGYTVAQLTTIAADTRLNLQSRSGAINALVEHASQRPDKRGVVVDFIRMLLTRPEAYNFAEEETFLGFLIVDILELGARELYPDIESAYKEARVDTNVIELDSVQMKWGIQVTATSKLRNDGLYLRLRCTECGREREHFVQNVILDLASKSRKDAGESVQYDPFIMDREIICPKCGSRDRYEVTPLARLRLYVPESGGFFSKLSGGESKHKLHPRVIKIASHVFGSPMHPLEGFDKYREMIAANPRDASLHIRMGNLMRTLHRYPQAIESFRRGYALGTDNPELIIAVAMGEHDFGDRTTARILYERVKTLASKELRTIPRMRDLIFAAKEGLRMLAKSETSPWELPGATAAQIKQYKSTSVSDEPNSL